MLYSMSEVITDLVLIFMNPDLAFYLVGGLLIFVNL